MTSWARARKEATTLGPAASHSSALGDARRLTEPRTVRERGAARGYAECGVSVEPTEKLTYAKKQAWFSKEITIEKKKDKYPYASVQVPQYPFTLLWCVFLDLIRKEVLPLVVSP